MSDRDVRKLAKIVADHSRQIKGLSGGPQAAYSSIEGGSMDAYDNDGKMRLRIGAQDDGTHAVKYVQGPPPPRPTAPVVSVDGPVVRVRWDGMLMGGHIPEDFARIDVHFALASDDLEAEGAVRGNLATSAGNETVLAATQTGTYRVGLVAMSQSRARSEMSETVDVDVTLVDIEGALDAVVENARGGSNYYSPEPPSGTDHDPDRDLWFDTSVDAEGLVSYSPHRWDADLLEWVSVADQRTAALQDALGDFEGTVEQRFTDAGERIDGLETSLTELDSTTLPGLRQDLDAAEGRLGEAEGQITDAFGQLEGIPAQISAAQQAAEQAAQGYTDAQLSSEAADLTAAILAAQSTADEALNAADGAIRTYYEATEPTLATHPDLTIGDMWYDTVNEDAYRWNGSQWNIIQDSNVAVALAKAEEALAVADGKITTYRQNDKPTEGHVGDLWFDLDDGNAPWYCASEDPAVWVPVRDEEIANAELRAAQDAKDKADQALQDAQEDATQKADAARDAAISAADEALGSAVSGLSSQIDTVRTSVDGKNRITQSTSTPPAQYDGSVGDRWERMSSMGSGGSLISNWRWNGDVWVSTIISDAVLGNVDAAKIGTGYLDAARIRAGSIYADRIVSGLSQNMVPDPGFLNEDISAARLTAARGYGGASFYIADGELTINVDGTPTGHPNISLSSNEDLYAWSAYPGMRVVVEVEARTKAAAVAEIVAVIRFKNRDGSTSAATMGSYQDLHPEFAKYTWEYTLPQEVAGFSIVLQVWRLTASGAIGLRSPFVASSIGTTVIEDGAITTGKLRADVLEVGNLKAGTGEIAELVSRKIAAATGQFLELDVGQLTVTEQSKLADVVAEQIAADTAQFMELEVGKLVASEGILDEAVIKQLFAEVVVSQMSFADEFIGGNAILEGSITAESGIIGSLDLGVAIVGKLHGQYVEAGSIDTEQLAFGAATGDVLSVDALNFKTAVGLDIRGSSFRAGDAVEMTEDFGIRQFGPDGALNVSLPSDGSPAEFRGDLSARTLTATGRMSIQGPGAIASGGVLELESGVVPPVAGPQITNTWDRITMPPVADDESVWGPAWAGGSWWRAINKRGVVVGDRIERISPTGELEASFPTDVNPRGLTSIGDELFLLGTLHANSQGADQVLVYSLTGTLKRRWEYPNYGTGTYQPGIGTDGTDILIAQCWQDGLLTWRRFNKTTGALVSTHNTSHNFRADVSGIYIGAADFGATRVVVGKKTQTAGFRHLSVFDTSSPYDYRQDLSWYAADMRPPAGFAWDGQQFHSLTPTGDLVSYQSHAPGRFVGDDEDDWWVAASWVTLNMGETTVGPASRFSYLHRAKLRLQYGDVPAGVEAANSWFAKGPTAPARTDLHWVNYSTTPAAPAAIASISSGWGQARSPLAVGTFTADTPGEIHSALGNFRVDGAGAGSWGPLTFHADGSMTSAAVPTWTPITSFNAGFTAATWTDVPAYRVWPDGKVEWRGTITGTFNGTMFPFVVPPAARAGRTLNFSVACGGTATGTSATTRLEFSPAGDPGGMRVFRGDSDKTWVDLGSIYYYLT